MECNTNRQTLEQESTKVLRGKPKMEKETGLRLNVLVRRTGKSLAITLPVPLTEYLQLTAGDTISLSVAEGKKGKYFAGWLK